LLQPGNTTARTPTHMRLLSFHPSFQKLKLSLATNHYSVSHGLGDMFGVFNMYERHDLRESLPSFAQLTECLRHPSAVDRTPHANALPCRPPPIPTACNSPDLSESQYARSPASVRAGSPCLGMWPSGISPAGTRTSSEYLRHRNPDSSCPTSAAGVPWRQPRPEYSSQYDAPRAMSPLALGLAPLGTGMPPRNGIHVNNDPDHTLDSSEEDMIRLPTDMPVNYGEVLDSVSSLVSFHSGHLPHLGT